jgi:hypothetical protein
MTAQKTLSSEVKQLLTGIAGHSSQHLTEVETDLVQTTYLLSEAIEKLGASFMAIHAAVSAQQDAVNLLLVAGHAAPEDTEKMHTMTGEIGQHVNAAVTGLQFQDMTSQLIGRIVKRVVGLREVLGVLEGQGAGIAPDSSADDLTELLHNTNTIVSEQSAKLESALWKAVCQTHMESGDIELF